MAFLGKPKDQEQYGRLMGMIAPEATPAKRIGTEAPTGSVAAGPAAGKSAAEFTQTTKASPGSVFSRQLQGANIQGITGLAEKPLTREAEQESGRVTKEGEQYREARAAERASAPQFQFKGTKDGKEIDYTSDIVGKIAGGESEYQTAENVLRGKAVETPELNIGDVKEFTPMQALRGGSVESLLRKEATGPYSTGMAGLDALLFAKKGGGAELAQRGQTLRATQQAAADTLEKSATEEERGKAKTLAETQKAELTKALEGDVKAREEAYTKIPQGGISKIQQAEQKLERERNLKFIEKRRQAEQVLQQEKQNLENAILQETLLKKYPDIGKQPFGVISALSDPAIMQSIKNDPEYQKRAADLNQKIFGQLPRDVSAFVTEGAPSSRLGLQNVMSGEDAAQYNRLQQLLGKQTITPQTVQAKESTFDEQKLRAYINDLISKSGMFQQTPTPNRPLGPSFGGLNI